MKYAILFIALSGCLSQEADPPAYDMAVCMPNTLQVISDCANATDVACECTTPEAFHVRVRGSLEVNVNCVEHCAAYGEK